MDGMHVPNTAIRETLREVQRVLARASPPSVSGEGPISRTAAIDVDTGPIFVYSAVDPMGRGADFSLSSAR